MYQYSLRAIIPYFADLPAAILTTVELSLLTMAAGSVVGLGGALLRRSHYRAMRILGTAYVEMMRNVPLLVLLYVVYFGIPEIGWKIGSFTAALIALTLNSGAYMTEIFRAGLFAIPNGQYDAARSQGMTGPQMFRFVVFPQVLRVIYAPLGNQLIGIVLGSSLASVIAVNEVTAWMSTAGSASFRYLETFSVACLIYVALCQGTNAARALSGRLLFRSTAAGRW